jgi:hypothetical protein
MEIYEKYIKDKNYRELIETQQKSIPGGNVYEQVTQAINRIQQDTNNTQIANLIGEVQKLKDISSENSNSSKQFAISSRWISIVAITVSIIIGGVQIYLAIIGVGPILEQQHLIGRSSYDFCKEPGNWNTTDGGATPGSTCKEAYIKLREKFGTYSPAEKIILDTESKK